MPERDKAMRRSSTKLRQGRRFWFRKGRAWRTLRSLLIGVTEVTYYSLATGVRRAEDGLR